MNAETMAVEAGDMEQVDLLFLAELCRDGIQLDSPNNIACFIDAPTLDSARAAAREAGTCGWRVSVHPSTDELGWVMRATRTLTPSWQAIVDMRELMVAIAARAGGTYDGWGVAQQTGR